MSFTNTKLARTPMIRFGRCTSGDLTEDDPKSDAYLAATIQRYGSSNSNRPAAGTASLESDFQRHYTANGLFFNLYSLWLFSFSDLKTIIVPQSLFGLLHAACSTSFGMDMPNVDLLKRIPWVFAWTWLNLLPFLIDNQRQTPAILEDLLNKPWRPMPGKRLSQKMARKWTVGFYANAIVYSFLVGGIHQSISLVGLGYWYNHLRGAESPVVRNFINASGFLCYGFGAMTVACGGNVSLTQPLSLWLLIIWGVVFTTVQIQDLEDQAGDRLRGRRTLPLVIGDPESRYAIAFSMVVWIIMIPFYWELSLILASAFASLGLTVVIRVVYSRSVPADKLSFQLWNLWMVFVYTMPLFYSRKSVSF